MKDLQCLYGLKAMSPDNPISRLFEDVYGASRLTAEDVGTGEQR